MMTADILNPESVMLFVQETTNVWIKNTEVFLKTAGPISHFRSHLNKCGNPENWR